MRLHWLVLDTCRFCATGVTSHGPALWSDVVSCYEALNPARKEARMEVSSASATNSGAQPTWVGNACLLARAEVAGNGAERTAPVYALLAFCTPCDVGCNVLDNFGTGA